MKETERGTEDEREEKRERKKRERDAMCVLSRYTYVYVCHMFMS